jgi:hypothetical protein
MTQSGHRARNALAAANASRTDTLLEISPLRNKGDGDASSIRVPNSSPLPDVS